MILGVVTILVFTGLAVLRVEIDQDQPADKRNQSQEDEQRRTETAKEGRSTSRE